MEKHVIQKCSSVHPWSPEELNMIQQLTQSRFPMTRKEMLKYQRENTLWVVRDRVQKNTIVGMASLSRVHTLDPAQAYGILHSEKLSGIFADDQYYLEKKLRQMMIDEIIDYASKKRLQYIQRESAPDERKRGNLYPGFVGNRKAGDIYHGLGFFRVARSSNAVHGTNFDRRYLSSEVY